MTIISGTCQDELNFQDWTSPKYLEEAHMDTRAQSQDAIFQGHTPDQVKESIKGEMKIQTFYSRALTA